MGPKVIYHEPSGRTLSDDSIRAVLDCIRHLVRALRISSRAAEQRVGLSGAQLFVLHKLSDGRTLSLGELADQTFTHQSSVSVVAQRLVARRLVVKRRARDDARRIELTLTSAGRALLRRAPEAAQERLIAGLDRLRPTTRRTLARLLGQLITEMGIADQIPAMFFEEKRGGRPRRRI